MQSGVLLITGGAGYLGRRLAQAWLEGGGDEVVLWVRARDEADLARARSAFGSRLPGAARLRVRGGDLAAARPFEGIDPAPVRAIVHAAAATRFNIDPATAAVNVEGTRKLLAFAEACEGLTDLTLLSSIYASGLRPGPILEEPYETAETFANHYERSKWGSEQVLLREFAHLPWRIARVATVIADDDDGRVTQLNAFHNTLKLFYYGLLSVIPGHADTPLYFVTGEFVTAALVQLVGQGPVKSILHLAHRRAESATLGELVDTSFATFAADPEFARRRVLKPLYSDADAFDLLADGVRSFAGGVVNQAVSSVTPFARQLFVTKDVHNDRLRAALPGYRAPDPRGLIAASCRFLVSTRWGRHAAGEAAS
jgi:nucleoside-diphosphate-sugar epimerase